MDGNLPSSPKSTPNRRVVNRVGLQMTARQSVRACFAGYVRFTGRATRSEYWWFFASFVTGLILVALVDTLFFNSFEPQFSDGIVSTEFNGPVSTFFVLAMLLPLLTAGWRRMHDTGRSGLYLLYPIIVCIGIFSFISFAGQDAELAKVILGLAILVLAISPLIVFWWLSRPSQTRDNIYGPNPHEVSP